MDREMNDHVFPLRKDTDQSLAHFANGELTGLKQSPFKPSAPSAATTPMRQFQSAGIPGDKTSPSSTNWTQMSINCIVNSGPFSSDTMLNALNERAFNLASEAIIKEANANMD